MDRLRVGHRATGKDLDEDKEVSLENMFVVNLFLFPHNSFNDS